MRIDPKHFNKFIALCALLTVVVIIFSTIHYFQKRTSNFEERVHNVNFTTEAFQSYSEPDSLKMTDVNAYPVIIHFWSTWSDKSMRVNQFLHEYTHNRNNLFVIAASVRDGEEQIINYIESNTFPFHFVEGTEFYHSLLPPGMPSQILLNRDKSLHSVHIGDDSESLKKALNSLMNNE